VICDGRVMLSVCLFDREQDYAKSSLAIFTKPCRIIEYCYEKN